MAKTTLTDQIVVITGGARGIGRATAEHFADRGARVVVGDIDDREARRTAERIGRGAVGLPLDVTSPESFTSFLDVVRTTIGPVDVLVNNAGIMPTGPFVKCPSDLARATIEINLWGVTLGSQLVLPHMIERGRGHIINVASALGRVAGAGVAVYSGTKFGVVGFSNALQQELRGSGVSVTSVLPGVVRTELSNGLNDTGPVADPADVAAAIVRACDTRAAEVSVPAWTGPAMRVLGVLPPRVLHPVLRRIGYDRALHGADAVKRASYADRLSNAVADHRNDDAPRASGR